MTAHATRLAGRGARERAPRRASAHRLASATQRLLLPVATSVAIVAAVQIVVVSGLVDAEELPPPTRVLESLWGLIGESAFWQSVWMTMQGWGLGLLLAVVVAVPLGLVIGSSSFLFRSVRPLMEFLRPIPTVALLPLFILLFSGIQLKAYLVAVGAFWPMLVQTIYGVRDVDPVALDTARAFRLRPVERFVLVVLPGASPYIATGLRISATLALVVTVALEIVVGTAQGIGASLVQAQQALQIPQMYAYVVAAGVLGLVVGLLFTRLERTTLAWHPSQREAAL